MSEENTSQEPIPVGGMGGVFLDRKHVRRSCRDIIQILQFGGVYTEEEVRRLVRAARPLAMRAAQAGNARNYAGVMRMLATLARLEQFDQPKQIEHEHNHSGTISIEQRRTEILGIVAALRERAGTQPTPELAKANGHSRSNGHAKPPDAAAE